MVDQITDIVPSDRRKLKELFHRFSQVISVGDGDLGQTKLLKHAIKTGDAKPIHQPTRQLPYHQRGVVQRMVKDMLQQGTIEHSLVHCHHFRPLRIGVHLNKDTFPLKWSSKSTWILLHGPFRKLLTDVEELVWGLPSSCSILHSVV